MAPLSEAALIESPIPMQWLIGLGIVCALPFAFFTYATGHGLFLLLKSVHWSYRKLAIIAVQAAIFLYLCLTNVAFVAPVTEALQSMLVSSRMLLQTSQDATAAFFAHHAASSHTACGVMGVVIAAWIRGFSFVFPSLCPAERPAAIAAVAGATDKPAKSESAQSVAAAVAADAAVATSWQRFVTMALIMHGLFALGAFLWFRFCIAPTVALYGMHMHMSTADALFLTSHHTLAFTLGMAVHSDFHRRRFHERSEVEIMQYYSLAYALFVTVPRVAVMAIDTLGVDADSAHSVLLFVMRGAGSWLSLFAWLTVSVGDAVLSSPYLALVWLAAVWVVRQAVRPGRWHPFHDPAVPIPAAPYTVEEHARALDFLPPYPDGWYKLYNVSDVPAGGPVRLANVLSQHFAVYRLRDGTLRIRDQRADCSTAADYEQSNAKVWHNTEWAQIVLVYYSLVPGLTAPPYLPLPLAGIVSGKFKRGGLLQRDNCTLHLQDVAENAGDTAHFGMVHGRLNTPILTNFFYIEHNVRFDPGHRDTKTGLNPHAVFHDNATLCAYYGGKKIPDSAPASVHFQGPGILVFKFATPKGDVLAIKTFTPRGPLCHRMDDEWWYDPAIPYPFARFVLHEGVTAFGADITIWNRKTYFHKPVLCTGDGPIYQVRRWFRQFYNTHSLQLPPVPPRGYAVSESWDHAAVTAATAAPAPAPAPTAGADEKSAEPIVASA